MKKRHPGTVQFVDATTRRITRIKRAEDLPDGIKFVGNRPVVRVVRSPFAGGVRLFSFGEDGKLLQTLVASTTS